MKPEDLLPVFRKQVALNIWSTDDSGMDVNIAYKLGELLKRAGCVDVTELKFEHGYGYMARDQSYAEYSAQLGVQCYRTLDRRIGGTWIECLDDRLKADFS